MNMHDMFKSLAFCIAAAIADATPISPWQPTSAPATLALFLHKKPTSPAAINPFRIAYWDSFISFMTRTMAGMVPAEPSVGAVTARRPAAFPSETAKA